MKTSHAQRGLSRPDAAIAGPAHACAQTLPLLIILDGNLLLRCP